MRRAFVTLALLGLLCTPGARAQDATLSGDERAELIELLEDSRQQLEELAARATGDSWSTRPDKERWSVGEVVEHLVLAEEGLFAMATDALQGEEDPEWQEIAKAPAGDLVASIQDRSQKFQAPPQFVPKGEMDRDELLSRFGASRAKSLDFARTTDAPLKRHLAAGPAGKMNVHQWLVLLGGHTLRHNLQIEEVLGQLASGN